MAFNETLFELSPLTGDVFLNMTSSTTPTTVNEVAMSLRDTRFAVQTILTPVVVVIGLLGNILNILVLCQPSMRSSTNVYILVLSFADSIFLVFNFVLSILVCRKRGLPDSAYYFNPYGRFVSNFSGNVAVWVTVGFTVERYIAVCHPMHGKRWCTVYRAKLASLAIVLLTLINTLPTIFELEIVNSETGLRCRSTSFANSFSYAMGYSWWYVTVFTFIPLICLTIFNIVLIRALIVASRKRQQLVMVSSGGNGNSKSKVIVQNGNGSHNTGKLLLTTSNNCNQKSELSISEHDVTTSHSASTPTSSTRGVPATEENGRHNYKNSTSRGSRSKESSPHSTYVGGNGSCSNAKRQGKRMSREQNKVTLLLVTIVMIFLLCQLPWTALFLYTTYLSNNGLSGNETHTKMAGNICNLLGLINASVNFYLYSCFSKRFRKTFKSLLLFWRRRSSFLTSMV